MTGYLSLIENWTREDGMLTFLESEVSPTFCQTRLIASCAVPRIESFASCIEPWIILYQRCSINYLTWNMRPNWNTLKTLQRQFNFECSSCITLSAFFIIQKIFIFQRNGIGHLLPEKIEVALPRLFCCLFCPWSIPTWENTKYGVKANILWINTV